ncbi:unnamed protein product, partial [Didymodactylos carnosus]
TTETMEESTTAALRRTNNTQNFRRDDYYNRNYPRYSNYDRRWPQQQNSVTYQQSPYQQQSSMSSRLVCYNCSGYGHYSYQCPSHLNE